MKIILYFITKMPLSESSKTFLFFLKLPELNNLLTLRINVCFIDKRAQQSEFHLKIMKSRELIFGETDILATPVNNGLCHIIVVVPKTKLKNQEFVENLKKKGLKVIRVEKTSASTLQDCFQYTSTAKLAPSWNILQNILVGGPDFLTSVSPLNAVSNGILITEMDLLVSSGEISLCLEPMCIKLSAMKMEDYIQPEKLTHSKFVSLESCYVLPSLKKGTVVSVSRSLDNTNVFKNYNEVQKHWNDMYGYVLPNVSEQYIWYFNVKFNFKCSPLYAYPQFCVKPYGKLLVPRMDPRPILSSFIKDFCKKVGNICGEKCKIMEGRASFTSLELFPAFSITEDMKPRAGTTYVMKSNVPYRKVQAGFTSSSSKPNINEETASLYGENMTSNTNINYNRIAMNGIQSKIYSQPSIRVTENQTEKTYKSISIHSQSSLIRISSQQDKKVIDSSYSKVVTGNSQVKYAPHFYPVVSKTGKLDSTESQSVTKPKPLAPVFLSKQRHLISVKSTPNKSKHTPKSTQSDKVIDKGIQENIADNIQKQDKIQVGSSNGLINFKIKKNLLVENCTKKEEKEYAKKRKSEKAASSKEKVQSLNKKAKKESKK